MKDDVEHLLEAIKANYPVKVKMEPDQYVGIDLKWDYNKRELICSMDGYVVLALKEFGIQKPKQTYYGPSLFTKPKYGERVQYTSVDTTRALTMMEIKFIQQVTGKFLFYARAVDNTMMHTLNNIATSTINSTEQTLDASNHFLNYAACNPLCCAFQCPNRHQIGYVCSDL